MKIKKLAIIINIVLILFTFIFIEAFVAFKLNDESIEGYIQNLFKTISADEYFKKLYNKEEVNRAFNISFRPDENINSDLQPILLMGCSFTYGSGLNDDETFSHKLGILTKRPIYNRAGKGWGLDQMLFQLQGNKIYKDMKEPEYLIYTFMNDQVNRFNKFKVIPRAYNFKPRYKLKNGKLFEIKPKFTDRLYSVEQYQYLSDYKMKEKIKSEYMPKLCKQYFIQARDELRKHWKNTKFIIIHFHFPDEVDSYMNNNRMWDELREEGFTIYTPDELTSLDITHGEEYYIDYEGCHPSKKAWDDIVPSLIKRLNL